MYPLQWHWPCIFTATEVVGQITGYHVNAHMLHVLCILLSIKCRAIVCDIYSRICKGFDRNALVINTLKQYHGPVMILDPYSQKCLSHNLINDISYKNASTVTSVVQHLQLL